VDDTFGLPTVTDILQELEKPGRDPRPAFKTATFAEGVDKIGDLKPGMRLEGQVTNVAAFGAFIDIGVHQDGLAHVSALSKNFVKDPREVVKPGDIVKVKVLEVDIPRQRISLTLRLDDEIGAPTSGGRPGEGRSARAGEGRGPGGGGGQGRGGGSGSGGGGGGGSQGGGQGRGSGQGRGPGGQGRGSGGQGGQNRGGGRGAGNSQGGNKTETPMDEGSLAEAFRKAGFTVR
jgi:uncharacterized protein